MSEYPRLATVDAGKLGLVESILIQTFGSIGNVSYPVCVYLCDGAGWAEEIEN